MKSAEKARVLALVRDGVCRVLVAPASLCWDLEGADVRASFVAIVDTVTFDGKEHR
jgi:hypothetical protein